MKSSLNKALISGSTFLFLNWGPCNAQPIQLIPPKDGAPVEPLRELPLQEVTGFWEGTPPSLIEAYFPQLPLRLTSPTLRSMRAEILKEKYTPLLQSPLYEKTLLSLFMETSQIEQAKEFLSETNLSEKENLFIDLLWLSGESKKACEKIANLIRTSPNNEWKRQNVYCLYLNGEGERGKIASELLSETTSSVPPLLNALFDPSSHPPFEDVIGHSPFLLNVWCTLGQDIPEEVLNKLTPASLALIARSEKMPLTTRLLAAQMALQLGDFKGEDVLTLLKEAPSEGLLEKFAEGLKSPKTEILLPLFEKARNEQKLSLIADVFKPLLIKIDPSPETLPLAPSMIRTFLEGGEKDLAQKWGTFFMRESPDEAIATLPLLHMAFPENNWGEAQLQAWQAYQSRVHQDTAAQNSYLLRHVLEALGEGAGPAMKGEPATPSWRQEKALFGEKALGLLDSAAASKRKGEVLLLILTMIGDTPLVDLSPEKFIRLLGAFHKAGYTTEARALALEFLLAKGV
jgi:hypothetical protein